jgi:murein DD-endopeptidase MepM/ murein hydrolase activator NlpD
VKIRITENQYSQLVREQRFKVEDLKNKLPDQLKKVAEAIINRLTKPSSSEYIALRTLSRSKLENVLSYIPSKYKNNKDAPTLYPIPTLRKKINSCYGKRWGRMHSGVDLDTTDLNDEQPLISACAGIISKSNDDTGGACGGFIKINCNNGDSVGYCHLKVVNENLYGLTVPKGFPIGVSGGGEGDPGAGNSMGPHLHYIIWQGGKKVNPINVMDGGHSILASGSENRKGKFCNPNA